MNPATMIERIIAREAGFVDHPNDRGGPTKYGVTAKSLGHFRGYPGAATRDQVEELSSGEAKLFYRWYLREAIAVGVPAFLLEPFADVSTMSGTDQAIKTLQRALKVKDDGEVGVITQRAMLRATPEALLVDFVSERIVWLAQVVERDRTQGDFIDGWMRRTVKYLAPLRARGVLSEDEG